MPSVIIRADGGVSIAALDGTDEERAALLAKWVQSARPGWLPATIEPFAGEVPPDRTFRNAWVANAGKVAVDMPKARNIHRERLRVARAKLLPDLDTEWFKAVEAGDAAKETAIAARKQKLRDVPADPRIDSAQTPDELKALTLDMLASG